MRVMKNSGIEYIGEIPHDWEISNLKYKGFTKSGLGNKKPEDFGQGYPFISYKNIYTNFSVDSTYSDLVKSTDNERKLFNVLRGDAFFTGSSETIEELGMASMCLEDIKNATYNGFSIRFRPYSFDNYYPEYMMYYFRSFATREHLVRNDNSITRANLSQRLLNMLPILIPSLIEQKKIASYLSHKVATIDNIIEKTKQSIEEYRKLKQSIITEIVTKGLNPDVKMKDSGIEWIGEIPEHWEVLKHKYIMNKSKEICFKYDNENIISLTKSGVILRDLENPSGKMPTTFDGYQYVYPGNLLLCLFDIDVTPRCVGLIEDYGLTSPAYSQFIVREGYHADYYNHLLEMIDDIKAFLHLSKNLRSSLTEFDFGEIMTIVPPFREQVEISRFLKDKKIEIESFIQKKEQFVAELELYKKSLIYEVVTGKKEIPTQEVGTLGL